MKSALLILISISLCGCVAVPYPHKVTKHPEIKGRIIQKDQPVENLTVVLTKYQTEAFLDEFKGGHEKTPLFEVKTQTNSNGEFFFPETKEWTFFKFLILAPVDGTPLGTSFDLDYQIDSDENLDSFPNSYQTTDIACKNAYVPIYLHHNNKVPQYDPINLGNIKIPNQRLEPTRANDD